MHALVNHTIIINSFTRSYIRRYIGASIGRYLFYSSKLSVEQWSDIWSSWSDGKIDCLEVIQFKAHYCLFSCDSLLITPFARFQQIFLLFLLDLLLLILSYNYNIVNISAKTHLSSADLFSLNGRPSRRSDFLLLTGSACNELFAY